MQNLSRDDVSRLRRWENTLTSQSESENDWAISILQNGVDSDGTPALFFSPHSRKALEFAASRDVDLVRQDREGYTLLHDATYYDREAFAFLAGYYGRRSVIDLAEMEGITPLSAQIKRGNIEFARMLLDNGASPNSFATIARYGGARLDIANQAVNALAAEGQNQEDLAMTALKLLKSYGLVLSPGQKQKLLDITSEKAKVHEWISANL